jgi:hypothetical protein
MNRMLKTSAAVLPLIVLCTVPALADVKTRERSQVKFEGMLGRMVGMFGGKAARDGIVTTNAVRGDRKVELTDTTGRIVDLQEQKVYELDIKRRTYQVTTFDELRRRMREAQEKAAKEAAKQDRETQEQQEQLAREVEIDFDLKETGQTRAIAGHNAREVVMTVTVRQKGRTLEDGGGLVMTSSSWMGPEIPAMRELAEFEMRYWKAIAPEASGMSAEQMAAVMAMYPMLKNAMERLQTEGSKLEGTPLATTTVFESVRSKEQMAQQQAPAGGGGAGLGGLLAGRLMKRDPQPRSTVFTITTETLEVSQNVAPAELEIPAGFKERK